MKQWEVVEVLNEK